MDMAADGTQMSDERHARVHVPGANGQAGSVVPAGVWVDDSDEDDPVLRQADGTWSTPGGKSIPTPSA